MPATKSPSYDSRSTIYLADPRTLAVDWSKNLSRGGTEPPIDDDLIALARSMVPKNSDSDGSSGQLNPILCRTATADGRIVVMGGFRRYRAAIWLIESGTCPDFKIKYTTSRLSDLEAALANMDENLQREAPQPIQLAHAVRRLTEDYGMSLEAVAARLKRSTGYLNQLLNLVMLPQSIQSAISDGTATVTAGIELARLPEHEQSAVFSEVKQASPNGTVKAAAVRKAARKKAEAKQGQHAASTATARHAMGGKGTTSTATKPAKPAKPARALKRSLKDLETFLEDRASITEPERGKAFANALLDFIDGKTTEEQMEAAWSQQFA